MLRPSALNKFLEKTHELFSEIDNIFICNPDGSLLACTNLSKDEKNFAACLSNMWTDYYDIGKIKFGSDGPPVKLLYGLIEHEKGKVVLTTLCDNFVLGFNSYKEKKIGSIFQKMELVRSYLEQQFKQIVEQPEGNQN